MSRPQTKTNASARPDRRRPTAQRQLELIDAALRIIETRGIAALSTRELARELGLTSGAIFRHFPSVEALLEAVIAHVEVLLDATFPGAELEPRTRLLRFIERRSAAVGRQKGVLRLVLSEQFVLALPPTAAAGIGRCVEKTRSFIVACVRDGQRAAVIRDDVDAQALAVIVMGVVQMLALARGEAFAQGTPAAPALVRAALELLLDPAPRKRPKRDPRTRKESRDV